jgi:hypothetical protein
VALEKAIAIVRAAEASGRCHVVLDRRNLSRCGISDPGGAFTLAKRESEKGLSENTGEGALPDFGALVISLEPLEERQ